MASTAALGVAPEAFAASPRAGIPEADLPKLQAATQEDPDGTLWFGTYNGGLNRFDPKTHRFKAYKTSPTAPHALSDDIVRSLCRDSSGVLWAGGWNNGLNRFDRSTETFRQFRHDPGNPDSLGGGSVTDIYEDRAHTLWVATEGGGLNQFDPATETFKRYRSDPKDLASLPDDAVRVLHEDQAGQFWVGTAGGLCAFDRTESKCTSVYTQKEGLPNNTIEGILEDTQGKLWISTNNGLARFNPETKTFRNYDVLDGLQSNEFNVFTAFHKSARTGEMYFGGINGFNVFDPDRIEDNPFVPPVVLTDFRLFGKSVPVGGGNPVLTKNINRTEALKLPHFQNSLSFEFSALSYVAPTKNRYRYRLEGFDQGWREVGSTDLDGAPLDLSGYADAAGAISVQHQGGTVDPYFALQALLLGGLRVLGANHGERGVRKVNDPHHPKRNREANRDEKQHHPVRHPIDGQGKKCR